MRAYWLTLTGALLFCGCRGQSGRPQPESSQPSSATTVADRDGTSSFAVEIAQLDDGGLSEFLEENVGETVYLDLSIPAGEFQGGQQRNFAFFTVYEDCPEDLDTNEKPNGSKCEGTEYILPKQSLTRQGEDYRVTGYFRPSEKSGPNQGMFSVKLDPPDADKAKSKPKVQ
jgi:hypothetical protein